MVALNATDLYTLKWYILFYEYFTTVLKKTTKGVIVDLKVPWETRVLNPPKEEY